MDTTSRKKGNLYTKRDQLLQEIARTRQIVLTIRSTGQIQDALDVLETKVKNLKISGKTARNFAKEEKTTLRLLQQTIRTQQERVDNRNKFLFLLSALPTVGIYFGLYLVLIPSKVLAQNVLLYGTVAAILFFLWIFWVLYLLKVYKYVFIKYILPLQKYPAHAKTANFAARSMFIFFCMQPLFQLFILTARIIQPSWGSFINNMVSLSIAIALSSPIAALLSIGGVVSITLDIFRFLRSKAKKRTH